MKKNIFYTLLSVVMLCSCTSVEENEYATPVTNLPDLTASFTGDIETKTYVANSKDLYWHEGDMISTFFGNTLNRKYMFNGKTGDNSGTFSHVSDGQLGTGSTLSNIYALYPYNSTAQLSVSGELSLQLPAVQNYASNSFGRNSNTMVAVTESTADTFLSFKNVCGYLVVKLYDADATAVQSIELQGNGGEKIAGAAVVTMNYGGTPSLTMQTEATTTVTLNCGGGVKLGTTASDATEFWFVLPKTTFSKGITIVATAANGSKFEQSTSNKIVIERNSIQPMTALSAKFELADGGNSPLANIPCASNEIIYQTTDGNIYEPQNPYGFGAKLISNTYEDGIGRLTFNGNISVVPDGAFAGYDDNDAPLANCNLYSIKLPEGIISIGEYAFGGCINLKYVTLPSTTRALQSGAFEYCQSLQSIVIPEGVETISSYLFDCCTSLSEIVIPNSVTTIEVFAFENTGFTSFVIPDSVTTLGDGDYIAIFSDCKNLESLTIGSGISELPTYDSLAPGCPKLSAFYGNFASEDHRCLTADNTLLAFAGAGLSHYDIPDTITTIGRSAFDGNTTLESVTIPNSVTSIDSHAFYGCVFLDSIVIPDSVKKIGYYAFAYCASMQSATIGKNVSSIGDSAFYNCYNLSRVYLRAVIVPEMDYMVFDNNFYSRVIYVPHFMVDDYKNEYPWANYADDIQGYDYGEDLTMDGK